MLTNKGRVLLVHSLATEDETSDPDFRIAPIGLFFIAGALKNKGVKTLIVPIMLPVLDREDYQRKLRETIQSFAPDYIGYSFRNLYRFSPPDSGSSSLSDFFCVSQDIKAVDFLRKCSKAPIIGGGSAFSLAPEVYMERLGLDYGIRGEGEQSLSLLLDRLNTGEPPVDVPGLVYKTDTGYHKTPLCTSSDEAWTAMDLTGLSLLKPMYYDNGGYGSIQTKRGCAFRCSYCVYPFLEGKTYRLRPVSLIINELEHYVHDFGMRHIYFVDSVFSNPPDHSRKITRAIMDRGLKLHWYAYVNPIHLSLELLQTYKASGCAGLVLTVDSGSDPMLDRLGKGFHTRQAAEAVSHLRQADIPFEVAMIIGSPGETPETMKETFAFCQNHLASVPITFTPGVWMHPSSPVYDQQGLPRATKKDILSRLVLDDDFTGHNSLHFFFSDHDPVNRGALIKSFISTTSGEPLWFVIGKDMVPDAQHGIMRFPSNPGIKRYARPWFSGILRKPLNNPLQNDMISEVNHV